MSAVVFGDVFGWGPMETCEKTVFTEFPKYLSSTKWVCYVKRKQNKKKPLIFCIQRIQDKAGPFEARSSEQILLVKSMPVLVGYRGICMVSPETIH